MGTSRCDCTCWKLGLVTLAVVSNQDQLDPDARVGAGERADDRACFPRQTIPNRRYLSSSHAPTGPRSVLHIPPYELTPHTATLAPDTSQHTTSHATTCHKPPCQILHRSTTETTHRTTHLAYCALHSNHTPPLTTHKYHTPHETRDSSTASRYDTDNTLREQFSSLPLPNWPAALAAAIVRIMKARKSLTHSLLISELFQQAPPATSSRAHARTHNCSPTPPIAVEIPSEAG